jgi:hypothetical protein
MLRIIPVSLAIGRMISDAPEKPGFNPGDEFAKNRQCK